MSDQKGIPPWNTTNLLISRKVIRKENIRKGTLFLDLILFLYYKKCTTCDVEVKWKWKDKMTN